MIIKKNAKSKETMEMSDFHSINSCEIVTNLEEGKDKYDNRTDRNSDRSVSSKYLDKSKKTIFKYVPKFMKNLVFLVICLIICNVLLIGVSIYGLVIALLTTRTTILPTNTTLQHN